MSTSLTAASTMGMLTSGAPSPTSTNTPPERVACGGDTDTWDFAALCIDYVH